MANAVVTYNNNGGSGSLASQSYPSGYANGAYLRSKFTASPPLAKSGYVFTGWNTSHTGQNDANYYLDNAFVKPWFLTDTILYAQWIPTGSQATLTYDGNGATSGVPLPQSEIGGVSAFLDPAGSITNSGYFFYGWNTESDGSGTEYPNELWLQTWPYYDFTLYAQWRSNVQDWYARYLPIEPRSGHSDAVIGSKIVFAGGSIRNLAFDPFVSRVDIYDVAEDSWDVLPNLSVNRYFMSSAVVGSLVLFAGGVHDHESNVMDVYDFTDPNSPIHSTTTIPVTPRHAISSVTVGNKVVFAGGYDGNDDLTEVFVFNSSDHTWSSITPLTIGRSFMGCGVVGNLVVFGPGYINAGYDYSGVANIYDFSNPESPFLTRTIEFPTPRSHMASAVIGNVIIFAGGEISFNESTNIVEAYNVETDTFIICPPLSVARSGLVSAVRGNIVYFAGGLTGSVNGFGTSVDTVDIFDFSDMDNITTATFSLPLGPRSYLTGSTVLMPDSSVACVFAGGCRGNVYGQSVAAMDIYLPSPSLSGEYFYFDKMKFDFYVQENIDFSELTEVAEIVDLSKL